MTARFEDESPQTRFRKVTHPAGRSATDRKGRALKAWLVDNGTGTTMGIVYQQERAHPRRAKGTKGVAGYSYTTVWVASANVRERASYAGPSYRSRGEAVASLATAGKDHSTPDV